MDVQLYTWNGNGEPESLRPCSKMSDLLESYASEFMHYFLLMQLRVWDSFCYDDFKLMCLRC